MLTRFKQCPVCGAEFIKNPDESWKQWDGRKYCSHLCHARHQARFAKYRNVSVGDQIPCTQCGTEVTATNYRIRAIDFRCPRCSSWKNPNKANYAKAYLKIYYARRPEGFRRKFTEALRKGILVKTPCEICGNPEVDGHHSDYTKPEVVKWLCKKHHHQEHRRLREAGLRLEGVATA